MAGLAGRGVSAAGAAPRAGKPLPARTLPLPRRLRMRVDDMCQAHRCAGGIQPYADHRVGSRRAKGGAPSAAAALGCQSLGALSGGAVRRRAPQRACRRVSSPCSQRRRRTDNGLDGSPPVSMYRRRRRIPHGHTRPPAARVSFAATSDSRDTRRGKARPQRDCRVGLRDQRGSQKTMRRARFPRDVRGSKNEMRAAGGRRQPKAIWQVVPDRVV